MHIAGSSLHGGSSNSARCWTAGQGWGNWGLEESAIEGLPLDAEIGKEGRATRRDGAWDFARRP